MFQVCYVTSEFSKHIRVNENLFVWALTGVVYSVYSNLLYRLSTSRLILAFGVQNFCRHLHSYVRLMIPIIVVFAFLPLEAAFHKFSTLLLITFEPIA